MWLAFQLADTSGIKIVIAHEIVFGISEANLASAESEASDRFKLFSEAVTDNEATGGGAS